MMADGLVDADNILYSPPKIAGALKELFRSFIAIIVSAIKGIAIIATVTQVDLLLLCIKTLSIS